MKNQQDLRRSEDCQEVLFFFIQIVLCNLNPFKTSLVESNEQGWTERTEKTKTLFVALL